MRLDTVYNKQSFNSLPDLVEFYKNKIFALFIEVLSKNNIKHLEQKIKVTSNLNGRKVENTFPAGLYLSNAILYSDEYKEDRDKLDQTFLENCQCPNKEDILEKLKYILSEVSETIDEKEWTESVKSIQDCDV